MTRLILRRAGERCLQLSAAFESQGFGSIRGGAGRRFDVRRWRIYCVIVAAISGLSVSASANTVTGRVLGAGGNFPPNGCFTIEGTQKVCTDAQKTFSVFLAPGLHEAEFTDSHGTKWTGVLPAAPQPVTKDLIFGK